MPSMTVKLWRKIRDTNQKLLKRGNFLSQADLRSRIFQFIDYFNKTMAKPFQWTYKGKVLSV